MFNIFFENNTWKGQVSVLSFPGSGTHSHGQQSGEERAEKSGVGGRDFPEEEGPGGTLQRTSRPHESMKPGPKMGGPQVRAVERFLKHPL